MSDQKADRQRAREIIEARRAAQGKPPLLIDQPIRRKRPAAVTYNAGKPTRESHPGRTHFYT